MKIAVDIGHNVSFDGGAVGIGNENVMNMETGMKVISKLRQLGHEVLCVTPKTATSLGNSLAQRVDLANNFHADLYLAIHYNCGGGHGSEVWCGSQSGVDVAQKILNEIVALGYTNRGVKIQGQNGYGHLYVLNNTTMKAILTEGCFVDSQDDMNKYDAEKFANAIVKGITGQVASNAPVALQYPGYLIQYNPSKYDENAKKIQSKLGIVADGLFGNQTKGAVIAFQKAHSLSADGIVGPITWKTLFN